MGHRKLNPEERAFLREEIFRYEDRPDKPCGDCGGYHLRIACRRIKRIATVGTGSGVGTRTEVEYWDEWDDSEVIYPEDVWDEEDDDQRDAAGSVPELGSHADGQRGA